MFDGFWKRVEKGEDCWTWLGARNPDGYGLVRVFGELMGTHRVAWMITNGAIPDGLSVLHKCDNPGCVRPDHLFLGTDADNRKDAQTKGRLRWRRDTNPDRRPPLGTGEMNGRAILTEQDALTIKATHAKGGVTFRDLAAKYGVSPTTVRDVVVGRRWKHLT